MVRRSSFPPDLLPGGGPDMLTMRMREPAGVVAELLPWNGPLMTGSATGSLRVDEALDAASSRLLPNWGSIGCPEKTILLLTITAANGIPVAPLGLNTSVEYCLLE